MIVLPPAEWRLRPQQGRLIIDGEWRFLLEDQSLERHEIYLYEVKGHPSLLKIGIARDSSKRKEVFYGSLLWRKTLSSRVARLSEYLFLHATYHLAHSRPPLFNVGNYNDRHLLNSLKALLQDIGDNHSSFTEVRQISLEDAVSTINSIIHMITSRPLHEAITQFGIMTFCEYEHGLRSAYEVPSALSWAPLETNSKKGLSLTVTTEVRIGSSISSIDAIREAGFNYVRWIVAQDEKLCPYCAARHGCIYSLSHIAYPAHPECRCILAPVPDEQVNINDHIRQQELLDAQFWHEEVQATVRIYALANKMKIADALLELARYRKKPTPREQEMYPDAKHAVHPIYEPSLLPLPPPPPPPPPPPLQLGDI